MPPDRRETLIVEGARRDELNWTYVPSQENKSQWKNEKGAVITCEITKPTGAGWSKYIWEMTFDGQTYYYIDREHNLLVKEGENKEKWGYSNPPDGKSWSIYGTYTLTSSLRVTRRPPRDKKIQNMLKILLRIEPINSTELEKNYGLGINVDIFSLPPEVYDQYEDAADKIQTYRYVASQVNESNLGEIFHELRSEQLELAIRNLRDINRLIRKVNTMERNRGQGGGYRKRRSKRTSKKRKKSKRSSKKRTSKKRTSKKNKSQRRK